MRQRNSLQRLGQFIRGQCTAAEEVGRCVYISDARAGFVYPVRLVDPTDEDKIPAVGIIIRKANSTECTVQTYGLIYNVFAGLERNKTYKVGTGGALQRGIPDPAPGGHSWIQFMGVAFDADVLSLSPEFNLGVRRD